MRCWKEKYIMRADYHVHTEFSDDSDYAMEKVIQDSIARNIMNATMRNYYTLLRTITITVF